MMTCVSERSGKASSGVDKVACTPQAASNSVPMTTRKRFWIDQRISDASILVAPIRGFHRRCGHHRGFRTLAAGFVGAGEIVKGTPQIGFGVNEELARGDNVLSQRQPLQDLRAAALLGADPHPRGTEMGVVVGDDHETPRAGLDDRLTRYSECATLGHTAKVCCRKHARPQMLVRIFHNDSNS